MARGPFLADLVRRTGVSGCVGRDRARKTSVPGRQSQGRQGYSQSIHSRPEHTPETMLSTTSLGTTRRVSFCLLSRAWTFAVEAGVSRGSAEEETKGLPDSTPALELSNLFKRGKRRRNGRSTG